MMQYFQSQILTVHLYHFHHHKFPNYHFQARKIQKFFTNKLKSNAFYLKHLKVDDNGTVYCGCCDDPTTINFWAVW